MTTTGSKRSPRRWRGHGSQAEWSTAPACRPPQPSTPTASAGGWWQYKRPGHSPQLIELRTRRLPFLTDGATPEILGREQSGSVGWFRLEGTGWRTEQNPARKASLRAEDPSEWSWRPCTADADPLPWPGPAVVAGAGNPHGATDDMRTAMACLKRPSDAQRGLILCWFCNACGRELPPGVGSCAVCDPHVGGSP